MHTWYQLAITVSPQDAEQLSELLFALGSTGLEIDDFVPDSVVVNAYFPTAHDPDGVLKAIQSQFGARANVSGEPEAVPDEDWGAKWREHFEPVLATPRIMIHPPWDTPTPPDGGFSIAIEPKTAFGTGSHPTTKMALLGLEQSVHAGFRVMDVGTGSGILSIAAVKLGAREVLAIDTDPMATENVAENVALNEVDDIRVETRALASEDTGFDVAVANIISSVLTPLLPVLREAVVPDGTVILGGLLAREEGQFVGRVEGAGLTVLDVTREAEWIGLITQST